MKIMQVDFQNDYGDPRRGINQHGIYGVFAAFQRLGHEAILFPYDSYMPVERKHALQEDLLRAVATQKPDLVFVSLFRDQFEAETLRELKRVTRTVCWMGDDTWRFESYSKRYAPLFSDVITTDPFSVPKYRKLGAKSVHLSQWAAMDVPGMTLQENAEYRWPVTFVGGANPSRRWLIARLQAEGIDVECFGYGWPNGVLSPEDMLKTFRTSKINLNLSNSILHDWRYLLSGPRALKEYFRSGKNASQIKARNFEIPYWGGFQLADYVPFLDTYFDIGREVACYATIEEAAMLIRYYLENDGEREKIRRAGMLRSRAGHSYFHRIRDYLAYVQATPSIGSL